ncbi:glycosyltransferase family 9 protein [Caenimonas sedimenti]|uniref:Glycosyltransferase family 9 protein n=1 Tax=Caenimonas sedimenti TaxID=2596921 RepID=A0A562ZNR1_9BURK|nr:glycosyltransferase family 9 protein [Caenimonas sedimenti]TWO70011.1 glycosyltransferase family 9 protein [Caenimonas sedimenti]
MRSVLVVVTRQIGDVLLTTPLIRAARRQWPDARIDVLGLEGTLGMLRGNPDIHTTIAMPMRASPVRWLRLFAGLWRRYDLALVADPGDRAHLIGWVAGRERAGLLAAGGGSHWWKRRALRHAVPLAGDLGDVHVVRERLALLAPWQGHAAPESALVGPSGEALPQALRQRLAPGYVVVHTPSMWRYKQWPPDHFRELIGLLALAGRQVVLTGGPGAGDRETVAAMEGAAPPDQLVDAGVLNFNQVAELLRGAALYIGPDTSVTHLAAACGTPVLAIFGPTNPQRWAPWPADGAQPIRFQRQAPKQSIGQVTLMQATLHCVPCGKAGCEDHRDSRADCLMAITPERVAAQALELLARR